MKILKMAFRLPSSAVHMASKAYTGGEKDEEDCDCLGELIGTEI
jgi:hypothetical protein